MIDIKEILFWIFMVLSIVLVIWYVFGNSPEEFLVLVSLMLTGLFKTWSVSDRVTKIETKFNFLARDFKELQHKSKDHR